MSLKVIRISAAAYTKLKTLSEEVMDFPIARVVEELARIDPSAFRKTIAQRLVARSASDAGDGSSGESAGTTPPPRTGSAGGRPCRVTRRLPR